MWLRGALTLVVEELGSRAMEELDTRRISILPICSDFLFVYAIAIFHVQRTWPPKPFVGI
jgi:hypothetical protein